MTTKRAHLDSTELLARLNATGISFKRGQRNTGHFQIVPTSNLKPFTTTDECALISVVESLGYGCTKAMVRSDWRSYEAKIGFGFRVYVP